MKRLRRSLISLLGWVVLGVTAYVLCCIGSLFLLRWINPPFTTLQAQRRIESWFAPGKYRKQHFQAPIEKLGRDLPHAVVAAEDTRFFEHDGVDWKEIEKLVEEDLIEEGKLTRGGSTITQQLIKNLFATSHRSLVRKPLEFLLAPVTEVALGKQRILELYLNNIEWGPGVFGAEAAARYYYHIPAARLSRDQAARLAAIIPNPRRRRPDRMGNYASIIMRRMQLMGW